MAATGNIKILHTECKRFTNMSIWLHQKFPSRQYIVMQDRIQQHTRLVTKGLHGKLKSKWIKSTNWGQATKKYTTTTWNRNWMERWKEVLVVVVHEQLHWDTSLFYFHSLTNLSWLAEATYPVTVDTAKAAISPWWADRVMVLFSLMFHSSKDCKSIHNHMLDKDPELATWSSNIDNIDTGNLPHNSQSPATTDM